MNLTHFQAFLAVMADSDFSWVFYLLALLQIFVAAWVGVKQFCGHKVLTCITVVSLLLFPMLLLLGMYYACQPIA
jgi:hypothetical protein